MTYTKNLTLFIILSVVIFTILLNFCLIDVQFIYINNFKILFINLINFTFIILLWLIEHKNLEKITLFFLIWVGSLVIILSNHLLVIYLGLELQTFSSFVLIANNRTSVKSSEAGLKYFILGALSSGVYLLGVYFIFINNLSLNINNIFIFNNDILFLFGFMLISLSMVFKLALTPLHFWIPDIYEGSSWDVLSLLSTIPKISVILFLTQIIYYNSNLLWYCSLLSIFVGTIGAFNQTKLKRLLAYSGITHMGFIILGLSLNNSIGYEIFTIYLFIYILTTLTLFIIILNNFIDMKGYIINLAGLQYKNKLVAITLVLVLLSMAGLPPLVGFISKWFIIWNTICFNYFYISVMLILFSIIGIAYYLRISQIIYFKKNSSYFVWESILHKHMNNNNKNLTLIFLGLGLFFTSSFIINPDPLILFINYSIIN